MPLWPGVFQFVTFLSVPLSELIYIFAFGLSLNLSNSFLNWFFCYVPLVVIFFSKIVLFPCRPLVGMPSYILAQTAGRIFLVVLEYPVLSVIVLSCLNIFWFFFLSSVTSVLFSRVVFFCFTCVAFSFLS